MLIENAKNGVKHKPVEWEYCEAHMNHILLYKYICPHK